MFPMPATRRWSMIAFLMAAREPEHRVLGAPADLLEGISFEGAEQAGLRHPAQHIRLREAGARDLETLEPGRELPDDRLNLGQLRHAPPSSPATRCRAGMSSPKT